MAKRKKRRNGKRKTTIPIAPIAGVIAAPATQRIITAIMAGQFDLVPKWAANYVGVWSDGSFHLDTLVANVTPMVAGLAVHKIVGGKLGLNRSLAAAGVPYIRL